MKIPFIALSTQEKQNLLPGIFTEMKRVVESSQFILGPQVSDFESRIAEITGTRFAMGVNSGLDALILVLRALGISTGDEVITAPNSFVASAAAIALVGAKPVFTDVAWDYNLDPALIEAAITPRTKAILPVHLTGNPARMTEIQLIAKKHGLKVIEDAAQALGGLFGGKSVGNLSDAGCFSLHPLKNLHVWGDGGFITTNDEALYENLKLQRNHGLRNRDEVDFFSYNSRLDTLQAIVGIAFCEILNEVVTSRTRNAETYLKRLGHLEGSLRLPSFDRKNRHAWHVFQLWCHEREAFRAHLAELGIETKIHYPIPLHLQKASAYLGYKKGNFPVTEQLADGIISLPVRENLKPEELELICNAVCSFFDGRS